MLRLIFSWRWLAAPFAVILLGSWFSCAHAAAPLRLDGSAASFPLDGHLAVLEDPDGTASIDDIARRGDFQSTGRPGLAPGTLWYRFKVLRARGMPAEWVLAFGEPDIDDVRVFVPAKDGGFVETVMGRRIPSGQLPLAARRHVALVDLPEGEAVTIHVRLASQHKVRFEDAALWRPGALMFEEARQSTLFGIHFGILAVIVLGYALFGTWLRDGAMLLYALYVATIISRGVTHTAVVTLVFPDAGGRLNYVLGGIGLLGGIAAFIFMWDRILDLRKNFPRVHRLYLVGGSGVALSLLTVMSPAFSFLVPPAQAIMLAASIGSIVMAALLVRRNPGDVLLKFYLFAFLPVVLPWGVEIGALVSDAVPAGLGRGVDVFATMSHIAILSFALAYRLSRMQREQMGAEIALASEKLARQRLHAFIDMATHEFKTPLAVIDSAAQMLGMWAVPARPEVTDRIASIRRAVQRLVQLVETCLVGERNETLDLKLQPVAPADIVAQVAERNRDTSLPGLIVEMSGLPGSCLADGDLLGIALDALIDNARRYGPADQPIEIKAREMNGSISFAVHDRGPAIPPDEAAHVFDKYYRCTTSASVPGTGIGLHLVKTIAELHGGQVTYRPREGGGASFAVTVPVRQPEAPGR